MPPWHADPKHGKFANDRSLTAAERETLLRWANNGAPEGDPKDLPAAADVRRRLDALANPISCCTMPVEYKVPAEGFVEYEYLEMPTNLTEDRWIRGLEVRPGNREVVHHVIVTRPAATAGASSDRGSVRRGHGRPCGTDRWPPRPTAVAKRMRGHEPLSTAAAAWASSIGGFAPGSSTLTFEPGTGHAPPRGLDDGRCRCTTPRTAKAATDRTKIGSLLREGAAEGRDPVCQRSSNGAFMIPAGAPDYAVKAEMIMTADITLWQMLPHTHLRGKSWEYTATYPDGRVGDHPGGAEIRFQLADRLRVRAAAEAAEGHEDSRRRALRQFRRPTRRIRTRKSMSSGAIRPGKR